MSKFSKSKSEIKVDQYLNSKGSTHSLKVSDNNERNKASRFKIEKINTIANDNDFQFNIDNLNLQNKSNMSLEKDFGQTTTNENKTIVLKNKKSPRKNKINSSQVPIMPDAFNLNELMMQNIQVGSQESTQDFEFVKEIIKSEKECDNDYQINDSFVKLKIAEMHTALYTLLSITSGLIYNDLITDAKYYATFFNNKEMYDLSVNISINVISIGVLLFIIASVFRYLILIELQHSSGEMSKRYGFFHKRFFFYFLAEVVLALLHPNLGFHQIKYTTDKTWYLMEITYNLNDFFMLILLSRIYVIFRFFISVNKYFDSRSSRVAKMIGNKLTRLFAVRCIIVVYPYTFLFIAGSILIVTLAFMLKIIEGPVYEINAESRKLLNDYTSYQNCVWNILVTMTTVGYGDYFPLTNLGRFINIIASLIGTILVSLMIISLQNSLKFSDHEQKAYEAIEKYEVRNGIEERAARLFKVSLIYLKMRKKYKDALKNRNYSRFAVNELRKNVEIALYKRIEIKKDFKSFLQNIYEQISEVDLLKGKLEELQQTICKVSESGLTTDENISQLNKMIDMIEAKISIKEDN